MDIYIFDEGGFFLGAFDLEPGSPVPSRSTLTPPPETGDEYIAQWVGRWRVVKKPRLGMHLRPSSPRSVDVERDRRIDAGFEFEGVRYQSRPGDRENIAGAAVIALADPAYATGWIAADNSVVEMDAPTLLRFGRVAADHKQALIFAARQLKDMQPIPQDYTDDQWWPVA